MLKEIRKYLLKNGKTSISEMALILKSSPSVIEAALEQLVVMGKVEKLEDSNIGCDGSCSRCSKNCTPDFLKDRYSSIFYIWIN